MDALNLPHPTNHRNPTYSNPTLPQEPILDMDTTATAPEKTPAFLLHLAEWILDREEAFERHLPTHRT